MTWVNALDRPSRDVDVAQRLHLLRVETTMLNLLVRLLFMAAGVITSWLVARNEPNFSVIQMTVAVLLFVLFVFVLAFWPKQWAAKLGGPKNTH